MRSKILSRILSQTPPEVSERVTAYGKQIVEDDAAGHKAIKVIESCKTVEQLCVALKYLQLFKRKFEARQITDRIVSMILVVELAYKQKRQQFYEL